MTETKPIIRENLQVSQRLRHQAATQRDVLSNRKASPVWGDPSSLSKLPGKAQDTISKAETTNQFFASAQKMQFERTLLSESSFGFDFENDYGEALG